MMALVESAQVPLGTPAPDFSLLDPLTGKRLSLGQLRGQSGTLVIFMCNHCPYVLHVLEGMLKMTQELRHLGVSSLGICSNDAQSYPADGPGKMAELARKWCFPFPYLHDETQQVARSYGATCTPDFFLYDSGLLLAYRGQMDAARPGNGKAVTGEDLLSAANCLLAGRPVSGVQRPSIGCSIKWREH
jgi:peroxiredoxin